MLSWIVHTHEDLFECVKYSAESNSQRYVNERGFLGSASASTLKFELYVCIESIRAWF